MKHLLILYFTAFCLLLQEATSISIREENKKLAQLLAKLQAGAPHEHDPLAFSSSKINKQNGRVFYPIGYGADPTGVEDSSDAILQALNDAFQVQSGLQLLGGVKDLGGVIVDLQGGNYTISKPIRFPPAVANLVVQGGTLRASSTFPIDQHLIELWAPSSQKLKQPDSLAQVKIQNGGIYYEDITFRDILFDSSLRGGGIFVIDSARIRITNCFFVHFTSEGILVQKGHETFISSCFLGQQPTVGGDRGEKDFSGTGIDLASNDNAITDVAIFSAAIGVLLRGQANIVTGVHCYNKATYFGGIGILVKLAGAALTRIDNCYLDYTGIVLEDPVQVHITNGLFLGDANIVLKSIHGRISGLNVVENMFNGSPGKNVPIIALDGEFSDIDQVVIDQNNANGMSLKSTAGKLSVAGNGTRWVADFSPVLVFPNRISHFQYSMYIKGSAAAGGFAAHGVTNISSNVVIVESDRAVNGIVSVAVDQFNLAGETNFPM